MHGNRHPKYREWLIALDHMVDVEIRYFEACATTQASAKKRRILADLHKARQAFWNIADNLDGPAGK